MADIYIMKLIQSLSQLHTPLFDNLFTLLSVFGEKIYPTIFFLIIYWAIDRRLGEYLLLATDATLIINSGIKDVVKRPRPFMSENADSLRYVRKDNALANTLLGESYSFPSGHAQITSSYMIVGAMYSKKLRWYIISAAVIIAVMLSRVYLGVHYPSDVLAGTILGIVTSVVFFKLYSRFYEKKRLVWAAMLIMSLILPIFAHSPDSFKTSALSVGIISGMFLEDRFVRFSTDVKTSNKVLRCMLGLIITLGVYIVFKKALPQTLFLSVLKYFVIGFFATYLWPLIFSKVSFM